MKMAGHITTALAAILITTSTTFAAATTSQPAAASQPVTAKVLKVVGSFAQHKLGHSETWVRTRQGDILDAESAIRTGVGSSVLIQLRETAIVQVRSSTKITLAEMLQSATAETTRVNLHYGTIRAGIVEGAKHSDFTIATPTAVLSREGTWGIEMSYDPATGNYYAGLDTEGLIRVVNTATGQRMTLSPGQFTTQLMQRWVVTATFQRTVTFTDPFGVTTVERTFYAYNSGGRTVANPTGPNNPQGNLKGESGFGSNQLNQQLQNPVNTIRTLNIIPSIENPDRPAEFYEYRFGNFGTAIPESEANSFVKRFLGR